MPSPFPGMDPYLEGGAWESFHAAYIDECGRQLSQRLRPRYLVRVERRFITDFQGFDSGLSVASLETYPDVAVMQPSTKTATEKTLQAGADAVGLLTPPIQLAAKTLAKDPQRSLAIRNAADRRLVTAIELLSPTNKRAGGGLEEYLYRREGFLAADVNLVEIDLLRRGTRLPMQGSFRLSHSSRS